MNLVRKLRIQAAAGLIEQEPLLAAELLARSGHLSQEVRKLLLDRLLEEPVPSQNVPAIVSGLVASQVMNKEQREKMLEYLLVQPLSDRQADICLNAAGAMIASRHQELTGERRKALLAGLLNMPLPSDCAPEMTQALIASREMRKEQREEMLEYLLSQPLSNRQADVCLDVASAMVASRHHELTSERRKTLLGGLLDMPLPADYVPEIVRALIASQKMRKEQREGMLQHLLSFPLSELQIDACLGTTQSLIDSKHKQLTKERRKSLLGGLLNIPLPSDSIPALTQALVAAQAMCAEQRDELLKHLLAQPLSHKQLKDCMGLLPEAIKNDCVPKITDIAKKIQAYQEALEKLTPWVDVHRPTWKEQQKASLYRVVFEGVPVENALMDLICEEKYCHLKDARIEFIDRKQLWLMMEELLFAEEYYCRFDREDPLILDCGTNIGLAIYYYKHCYPNARVVGFEPWDVAYACALRNVEHNGWRDVVIHNVALDEKDGVTQLVSIEENSLASSLTNRLDEVAREKHWTTTTEEVQVRRLSDYIDGPVDFLKMDIEGVENRVLREAEEKLLLIDRMFVEYHYAPTLEDNSLTDILERLDRLGFVFQISRSKAYERSMGKRPLEKVGGVVSELIWAKRINHNLFDERQAGG